MTATNLPEAQPTESKDSGHDDDRQMDFNELCKTARYYRWADKLVRLGKAFWHIISLDGLEIAATALSSTMECPTCECPKDELDRTDKLYPVRSTADVQAGVEKARAELLNRDGSIKDQCIGKVI